MTRLHITLLLGAVAVVFIAITWALDATTQLAGLTLNLGSEIIGIALTVAIVDFLIERNRLREEARRMAWSILHDIDHVVWVWQGGRREFHLDEMLALLDMVTDRDPIPVFTRNLMANLGVRARDNLRLQPKLFHQHRRLRQALVSLGSLSQIRELDSLVTPAVVVDAIKPAIAELAAVTGQMLHTGEFGVARAFRDPTESAQHTRYTGSDPGTGYAYIDPSLRPTPAPSTASSTASSTSNQN